MVPREIAIEKVQQSYRALKETRAREAEQVDDFSEACCQAHEAGVSDEEIKTLIDGGFSRPRIQQFRAFYTARQSKLEAEEAPAP